MARCAAAVLAVAAVAPATRADAAATASADGIRTTLSVDQEGATVDWRFLHRPPAPIDSIAATLNGRPLGLPQGPLAPFPAAGQRAALLCLNDAGPAAANALRARLAALPRGVGITLRTLHIGGERGVTSAKGLTDLGDALDSGIADLATAVADRRILLLLTDGSALGGLPTDALAERAVTADVAVVVALVPSARPSEAATLSRLASLTGGRMVRADEDWSAALLDGVLSGAKVRFPFGETRRYVWERRATVSARVTYGGQVLEVSLEAGLPAAGPGPTIGMLWARARQRLPAFIGGIIVALVGVVAFRRRPHASA